MHARQPQIYSVKIRKTRVYDGVGGGRGSDPREWIADDGRRRGGVLIER